jgi:tetratricopeptide (TPR) repeat protein
MSYLSAILLGLGIVVAQVAHGGVLVPALAIPAYGLVALAGVVALPGMVWTRSPLRLGLAVPVVALTGYVAWRTLHAEDVVLAEFDLGIALAGFVAWVTLAGSVTGWRPRLVFLAILLAAAVAQAVVGIMQVAGVGEFAPLGWFSEDLRLIYEERFRTRAHGLFMNPNHFAWLMNAGALFCLCLGTWGRMLVIWRILLLYFAVMFVAVEVFSASRGGLLSLVAGLLGFGVMSLVFLGMSLQRGRGVAGLGAVAVVIVCLGVGYFTYSNNWLIQSRVDELGESSTLDVRTFFLERALRQFQTDPLTGTGPGTFLYAARTYRGLWEEGQDAFYAHDDWVQFLAEYGFAGLALLLVAGAAGLIAGGRGWAVTLGERVSREESPFSNRGAIALGALVTTLAFCAHGFTDFNMHLPANALLAAAVFGLLVTDIPGDRRGSLAKGAARAFALLAALAGVAGLGLYLRKSAEPEYRLLLAKNAMARGEITAALDEADNGLRRHRDHAALSFARGEALIHVESALRFAIGRELAAAQGTDAAAGNGSEAGNEPVALPDVETLSDEERYEIYESAARSFADAVKRRPREREYRWRFADALAEIGHDERAEGEYLRTITLDPGHAFVYEEYAEFLEKRTRHQEAIRVLAVASLLPGGGAAPAKIEEIRKKMAAENESAVP